VFFYTQMAQHRGLIDGAAFLTRVTRDTATASQYTAVASTLESSLANFWAANVSQIVEVFNIPDRSGRDIATILGVLHSLDRSGKGVYTAAQDKVLQTAFRLALGFKAPAIGRYLEDIYNGNDGTNSEGAGPWLLAINAMAELYYRAAFELLSVGSAPVTSINQPFYAYLGVKAPAGTTLEAESAELANLVQQLVAEGDAYLDTLRFFLGSNQDMTEQFNPVTGVHQGARNLTWSYASFVTVARARSAV
ncbi:Six-hairpin glycosidase-like protein, partial [Blyttiomyces helicus]